MHLIYILCTAVIVFDITDYQTNFSAFDPKFRKHGQNNENEIHKDKVCLQVQFTIIKRMYKQQSNKKVLQQI